jgi:hypothetical protein
MLRAMKSLSTLNLQTSQTRNEEQNLRLSKEHVEEHVWFEDRWMVASLCDE